MKKLQIFITVLLLAATAKAQETVYPSGKQTQAILITNGLIHVGNGQVFDRTSILIQDGKITAVGTNVTAPAGASYGTGTGKDSSVTVLPVSAGTYTITFTYTVCGETVTKTFTLGVG